MAEAGTRASGPEFQLICEGHGTKMRSNSFQKLQATIRGGKYASDEKTMDAYPGCCLGLCAATNAQHIGKYVR